MTFQWNPDTDQTYNDDADLPLRGRPRDFNKANGKSFTMAAPGKTLTLVATAPTDDFTSWGGDDAPPLPTDITVRDGTLKYESRGESGIMLSLGSATTLTVADEGQFRFVGNTLTGVFAAAGEDVTIAVRDNGILAIEGAACRLGTDGVTLGSANIEVSGQARMAADCGDLTVYGSTIDVTTVSQDRPASFVLASPVDAPGSLEIRASDITFTRHAVGILKSPLLILDESADGNSQIEVRDVAVLDVQFDSGSFASSSRFVVGLSVPDDGKVATMRFDGFTAGRQPFDFEHMRYPQGLFQFTSGTAGALVIYLPGNAFAKAYMLKAGVIAIDGQPQMNDDRLSFTYNTGGREGYTTIRLKPSR